jgi:RNA polymerase sigma-70 factor (ECF subfamily)
MKGKMNDLGPNEILYKKYLAGDIDSYTDLVKITRTKLTRYIENHFIYDKHYAEDICQEVFIYVLQKPNAYDFQYSLFSFLTHIARYKALDFYKKNKQEMGHSELSDELFEDPWNDDLFKGLNESQVNSIIKRLGPEYQEVIYCIDYLRMTYKETASLMKKSLAQTKILLYRARKRLKFMIESEVEKDEKR